MQFVFTDIEGSSRLWHEHGDAMSEALRRHDSLVSALVETRGGRVVKHTGDGVFAVFEQGNALDFAVDFQQRIEAESWDSIGGLRVKIGVTSGIAQRWADDFFGPPVNRAARLAEAAWGGQIVVTARALAEGVCPPAAALTDLGLHAFGDLGEPERIYQLTAGFSRAVFPPLRTSLVHPRTLPSPPTPFIGREAELTELRAILGKPGQRLLTLAGPGGIGKTRLAIQLASSLENEFSWGVYFVPLASVSGGEQLVSAVAESLRLAFRGGLSFEDQLVNFAADKDLLLVLDNFEHMMTGLPLLARLLAECARIRLLVTSRERLLQQGEYVHEVQGMPYPDRVDDPAFEEFDAPRLFLDAGRRSDRSLELGPKEREALLRICRLTEGLPLALELSASWVRTLGLVAVAEHLESGPFAVDHRLRDVPERHRSLGAVLDYSYSLLTPAEQKALRALSIFKGGFTVEAAREVAGVMLETLAALMDKSLVKQTAQDRFELHELTRHYAGRLLEETGADAIGISDNLMRYYANFVSALGAMMMGSESQSVRDRITTEIDNIRAAWHIAVERQDVPAISAFLEPLYWFYRVPGRDDEGCEAFTSMTEALTSERRPAPQPEESLQEIRARAQIRLGHFQALACAERDAVRTLRAGLRTARRLKLEEEVALALQTLGRLWFMQGRLTRSQRAFEMSASCWRSVNKPRSLAIVLSGLGHLAAARGDHEKARSLHLEALDAAPQEVSARLGAYLHCNLGLVELEMGHTAEARRRLEGAMRQSIEDGDPALISHVGDALGDVYVASKDYANALSLFEESMRIRKQLGDKTLVMSTAGRLAGLANHRGDYPAARQWASLGIEEAKALGRTELALECQVQAAWADLRLDGPDTARATARTALREAAARHELTEQARALIVVAMMRREQGECARALEILASISHSPPDHTIGQWAAELLAEWRVELPVDETQAAEERSRSLDWRALGEECV
ncbi:MAG: tetratricopeptide repeat protein [Candidatus Eisenbacteria bacterium]|nr:tetratricopeptide repeat protein [Candidatus Eisenbacteria bacterium]